MQSLKNQVLNQKDYKKACYLLYQDSVRKLTTKNIKKEFVENSEHRSNDFVIDHKVSIKTCFENDLPVETAAHVCNLHIVSKEYNLKKGKKNLITVEELFEEIIKHDTDLDYFQT